MMSFAQQHHRLVGMAFLIYRVNCYGAEK